MPPTIKALLEARIGQLRVEERTAIEPASVIGLQFPVPAVASMTPEQFRPAVENHLIALTKKQLVHAVPLSDEDPIYRFHHHLVRDTIYNGLLKRTRATLHVDFVCWADRINAERGRGSSSRRSSAITSSRRSATCASSGLSTRRAGTSAATRRGAWRRPAGARSPAATCLRPATCCDAPSRR